MDKLWRFGLTFFSYESFSIFPFGGLGREKGRRDEREREHSFPFPIGEKVKLLVCKTLDNILTLLKASN